MTKASDQKARPFEQHADALGRTILDRPFTAEEAEQLEEERTRRHEEARTQRFRRSHAHRRNPRKPDQA